MERVTAVTAALVALVALVVRVAKQVLARVYVTQLLTGFKVSVALAATVILVATVVTPLIYT
jgi:hypothetical protein